MTKRKMRNILVFLFSIPLVLCAQSGVVGGLNISKKTFKEAKSQTGLYMGLFQDIRLTSEFYIQPRLLFSLGSTKSTKNNLETITKHNYLELHLYASFRLPLNDKDHFVLNIGPYVAQGISGKNKTYSNWNVIHSRRTFDEIPSFDYGISGGLGYANKNNATYFFLDYIYGLKEVRDTSRQNSKGHSISFRVGLAISLRFFDWM